MAIVAPGRWYLAVTCHHCRQGIALVLDPNQGDEPSRLSPERERETVTCPLCQKPDTYLVSEVRRAKGHPRGRLQ
jgi:hypothetical protein